MRTTLPKRSLSGARQRLQKKFSMRHIAKWNFSVPHIWKVSVKYRTFWDIFCLLNIVLFGIFCVCLISYFLGYFEKCFYDIVFFGDILPHLIYFWDLQQYKICQNKDTSQWGWGVEFGDRFYFPPFYGRIVFGQSRILGRYVLSMFN